MNVYFPSGIPDLSTNRLSLRGINEKDAADLLFLRSNPEIMRFIPRPLAKSTADVLSLINDWNNGFSKKESLIWGMYLKENRQLIGTAGFFRMKTADFRAELGYLLHSAYHGKGIMQEAITAIIAYGFSVMKLHSIEANVDPGNIASAKLLLKNGFVQEGHLKENIFFEGKLLDTLLFALFSK